MAGSRSALIVATYAYDDPGLTRLHAPERDADALVEVLGDPGIGGFEVRAIVNQPAHQVNLAIAQFFAKRRAEDTLLLHFSCHGLKDESGELYLAATDTQLELLGPTATEASFVKREMDRTRAGRVVLFLDCCYAAAFGRSMRARASSAVDINDQLGGSGRAIIAASSALEFAFEDGALKNGDPGSARPSVFTEALVRGLRSGEADRDQDGWVSLDELYTYVHEEVTRVNPLQNPKKWAMEMEGNLVIARRGTPVSRPSELPAAINESMRSHSFWDRRAVVDPLTDLLEGSHPGLALAARIALEQLLVDPDDRVKLAARTALAAGSGERAHEVGDAPEDEQRTRIDLSVPSLPPAQPGTHRRVDQRFRWPLALGVLLGVGAILGVWLLGFFEVPAQTAEDDSPTRSTTSGPAREKASRPARLGRDEIVVQKYVDLRPTEIVAINVKTRQERTLRSGYQLKWPNPSPDRTEIAFAQERSSGLNIPYVMDATGFNRALLLSARAQRRCPGTGRPAWSPDGSQFAVVCLDAEGASSQLVVLDRDGELVRVLDRSAYLLSNPTWSRADNRIYYAKGPRKGAPRVLHSVPANGGRPQRAALEDRNWHTQIDVNKDGVVYMSTASLDAAGDAYFLSRTGAVTRLTWSGDVIAVSLSPDGKAFAWATQETGYRSVWVGEMPDGPSGDPEAVNPTLLSKGPYGPPSWGSR